ncbi:MAG TPA: hypothetical protein VLM91_27670 [Candidatus Methylomirabilis sp.]|nr:hypothetical protein [Candidatus Methylomirabilis sp.]
MKAGRLTYEVFRSEAALLIVTGLELPAYSHTMVSDLKVVDSIPFELHSVDNEKIIALRDRPHQLIAGGDVLPAVTTVGRLKATASADTHFAGAAHDQGRQLFGEGIDPMPERSKAQASA